MAMYRVLAWNKKVRLAFRVDAGTKEEAIGKVKTEDLKKYNFAAEPVNQISAEDIKVIKESARNIKRLTEEQYKQR